MYSFFHRKFKASDGVGQHKSTIVLGGSTSSSNGPADLGCFDLLAEGPAAAVKVVKYRLQGRIF
jgi:hypothetical protein